MAEKASSPTYFTPRHIPEQADPQKVLMVLGSMTADCPRHNPTKVNTQLLPSNVEALCLPQKWRLAELRKQLWSSSRPTVLLGAGSLKAGCPSPCQIRF